MAVSDEEIAFATELFDGLGRITTRKMMGGLCLYADGTIFAIIHGDTGIMLKCKGKMIDRIEAMGGRQWTYRRDGTDTDTGMPYWTLPDAALDDPAEAQRLAKEALRHL